MRRFGADYDRYMENVRRWIPRAAPLGSAGPGADDPRNERGPFRGPSAAGL